MKEKSFSTQNTKYRLRLEGGHLWKASARKDLGDVMELDKSSKKLSIYLQPGDKFLIAQESLFDIVRDCSWFYYTIIQVQKRLPSLLMLFPISMTITFIAFITVWGDLVIKWVFMEENAMTVFGLPMYESAVLYAVIAILVLFFFPVLITGEQEGFVQALNARFANRKVLRKRFALLFNFLNNKDHIKVVEIWNPDLGNEQHDWVGKSLIPAMLDSRLEIVLHIRIDERRAVENYFQKELNTTLTWDELPVETIPDKDIKAIPYEFLENWEKSLLAVYVFASTASLSEKWTNLEGTENDGVLRNVVSLPLVKILIERFRKRLFSESDLSKLISLDLFASRCLNDYGILFPALRYTNDLWSIRQEMVDLKKEEVEEGMKFLTSFLQTDIDVLTGLLQDPVTALKLNHVLENESIYNEERLAAIRFFVTVISKTQQYKIFKKYWALIIQNNLETKDMNEDVYRIIGVDLLLELTTIFEKSAMYHEGWNALDYVQRIFPFRGKVGKARIKERQGNFAEAVELMLQILNDWKANKIELQEDSIVDLSLDISWAIVSGRLEQYRTVGRTLIAEVGTRLNNKFDTIRDTEQTIGLYNITANYEEWEGNPEGAIENYDKALKIPGILQAGLSNLLVNKGIALRQIKRLDEGAIYGAQGVEIKTAIGDADQLPIAQHNLAQTYIELAFFTQIIPDKIDHFSSALKHAQDGLNIQAQTGSVKKRGQLLMEKFIAKFELHKLGRTTPEAVLQQDLKSAQNWLKAELDAGRGNSYDCRVVVKELLSCLVEFKGTTIEEAIGFELIIVNNK